MPDIVCTEENTLPSPRLALPHGAGGGPVDPMNTLVTDELEHRIKNLFAVVNALINLTLQEDHSAHSFAGQLRGRLRALNQAHDFIKAEAGGPTAQPASYSLQDLLHHLLAPYGDSGPDDRLAVDGDDAAIGDQAATPLALIFHELATNALKHGALGAPSGTLHIRCTRAADRFQVRWQERGGPALPAPPARPGFGSRLLAMTIERQLHGTVRNVPDPSGLLVIIDLPLARLSA
jgi:two-component sensor histidine kinase